MPRTRIAISIILITVITSGFAASPIQLLGSFPFTLTSPSSQLVEYVYGEEVQGSQEEVYLKYVFSASQQESSNLTNTTTTIPQTAKGPAIPSEKGYLVQEIGSQLYSVSDGSYNVMFMVTDQ